MLPSALAADNFAKYSPQARQLAVAQLGVLRQMPLAFLPSLLQELIQYDYKFPAERAELDGQFAMLEAQQPQELKVLFDGFWQIRMTPGQEAVDWVNRPQQFTEQFSAYLWSTHQMDAFRQAATAFGSAMQIPPLPSLQQIPRLGIAVIGQGADTQHTRVFERLRPHGTYFSQVNPQHGVARLLEVAASRAETHPVPYGHWYVDGGVSAPCSSLLNTVSYAALTPVRNALLTRIQQQTTLPGMGPERLRDYLMQLTPGDLGLQGDPVLDRFQIKLLTEGSGTQIYSTTFAQWTAREVLRRAAALTLMVRFAPRQRQRPMSDLLAKPDQEAELDPAASLIDADMAAYYHWINQQRLPGHERSAFVAWFEGQRQAIVIGPSVPRAVMSSSPRDLTQLVTFATA